MKKIIFCLFIFLIAVTGCKVKSKNKLETNNVEDTYSINYNDNFYRIHKPYKKGVGKNYMLNSNVVDFDVTTIEKNLIQISTNTFDVDKYYYEEGQYLTKSKLKDLLGKKQLNDYGKKKINGKKVTPMIVAGIYEKNFVNKKGDIKGISLGIVLNRYHSYDSNNNYVTLDKDETIEFGKKAGKKLVKYMRNKFKLKNVPIMVALYLEASPNSSSGGNYLYYGVTEDKDIKYKYINQKTFFMNNKNVKDIDSENYNNFIKFEDSIRDFDNSLYISGVGHFNGNDLSKLEINVTKSYYSYGDLLYLNQLLSDKVVKYFKKLKVVVKISSINSVNSYIVKEPNQTTTDVFIY